MATDYAALDYSNVDELSSLPKKELVQIVQKTVSEEKPKGISALTAFKMPTDGLALYVAENAPEGMIWSSDDSDWVKGSAKKKAAVAPGRKKPGPKKRVDTEAEPKAPAPRSDDDMAEVLHQLETMQTQTDAMADVLKELAKRNELLGLVMVESVKLNHALLMNALGADEVLEATTLEEALDALGG